MRKLLSLLIALAALVGVSASSFAAGFLLLAQPATSTTQWDPTDHAVDITVTSNTVLTRAAGFSFEAARSLNSGSHSTGKYYFELASNTTSSFIGLGFANSTYSLTAQIGSDNNAVGYRMTGDVVLNGTNITTTTAYNANDVVGVAIDFTNKLLWLHAPGMTNFWNNNASANPATGTGGLSFSTIAAGPFLICAQTIGGEVITANFGATAYTYAGNVPSGFSNW